MTWIDAKCVAQDLGEWRKLVDVLCLTQGPQGLRGGGGERASFIN